MAVKNENYQFYEFNFGKLSDSENNLIELLAKHKDNFSKMNELKRFLSKLFFNESNSKRF